MKKLSYIAITCLIIGMICEHLGSLESFTGLALQITGFACLIPFAVSNLKKDATDIALGDKVKIEYWKRTRCGSEEESTEPFLIEGTVVDVMKGCNTRLFFIRQHNGKINKVIQSQISKIIFL